MERGTSRVLVEAKSTTGDTLEFKLWESEVRRAQDLAPDEEYLIILVTNVLDPKARNAVVLPSVRPRRIEALPRRGPVRAAAI